MVAVSAVVLGACRAEEQGRITEFKPGVYLGKMDTKLSSAQVRQLGQRTNMQGSAVFLSGGGGGGGSQAVDTPSLNTRIQGQRQP
ncbi:MAG: hypothetical protein IIC06_04185 [Proteobacteria bacterium]|nr:hypothetical protein [Pseudomonadota bacterium]